MLKDENKKVNFIFDQFLKKPSFKHNALFSFDKKDLLNFVKKSNFFFCMYWNVGWKIKRPYI